MPKKLKFLVLLGTLLPLQPASAEPVYEFVRHCKAEQLGHCFYRIQERLNRLRSGPAKRICLPRSFGATLVQNASIPVSLLEYVRLGLSAARFGEAGEEVDDVIADLVGAVYRCN